MNLFVDTILMAVALGTVGAAAVDSLERHRCSSYGKVTDVETKYVLLDRCYVKYALPVKGEADKYVFIWVDLTEMQARYPE